MPKVADKGRSPKDTKMLTILINPTLPSLSQATIDGIEIIDATHNSRKVQLTGTEVQLAEVIILGARSWANTEHRKAMSAWHDSNQCDKSPAPKSEKLVAIRAWRQAKDWGLLESKIAMEGMIALLGPEY